MAQQWVVNKIREMSDLVEHHPREFGVLSTSEQIAVAVVLSRIDLLKSCGYHTLDGARDRLGDDWWSACKSVQAERAVVPTADERAGMDWWNGLSQPERGRRLTALEAAEAWALEKETHKR